MVEKDDEQREFFLEISRGKEKEGKVDFGEQKYSGTFEKVK